MKEYLRRYLAKFLHWIFLGLAARLYDVVLVHAPDEDVTAVHFARSVRDLNVSMRNYVAWLDDPAIPFEDKR